MFPAPASDSSKTPIMPSLGFKRFSSGFLGCLFIWGIHEYKQGIYIYINLNNKFHKMYYWTVCGLFKKIIQLNLKI